MPIPERRREFLYQLGFLGRDEDGNEILLGLSMDETDDWFRLYQSRGLRCTRWFLELDRKHLAAWQIQHALTAVCARWSAASRAVSPAGVGPRLRDGSRPDRTFAGSPGADFSDGRGQHP